MVKGVAFLLLVLSSSHFANMSPIISDDSSENRTMDNDVMSIFSQDDSDESYNPEYSERLIQELRNRILKSLHITEAPKRHVSLPVLQQLFFYSQSEETETNMTSSSNTTRSKTDFIYANVENTTFADENDNHCVKFHIDLPTTVQNKDFESVELWLYKNEGITDFSVTRIISNNDVDNEERLTATVHNLTYSKGWTRFNISQMLYNENTTSLNIEVSSTSGSWCLEVEGNKVPFLLVRREERSISKRSTNDCTSENSTCCRKNLYVYFRDVGYGDWVVQPEGFDANYCTGACTTNIGLPSKDHGRILMALCERRPDKAREMGKTECITCVPTAYQSMSIIYLDEDGVQVISHMPDMTVTRCGCL